MAQALLTSSQRATIPKLYETDGVPMENKRAVVKLFTPWTNWTWYVIEFDGTDTCFGLMQGQETEFGYFTLSELEGINGPYGLTVERDVHFKPCRVSEIIR